MRLFPVVGAKCFEGLRQRALLFRVFLFVLFVLRWVSLGVAIGMALSVGMWVAIA